LAALGRAELARGDLAAAERTLREGVELARVSGNLLDGAAASNCLGGLEAARGRLPAAAAVLREVLSQTSQAQVVSRFEADVRLALICVEWDQLAEAERHLTDARQIGPLVAGGLFAAVEHLAWSRLRRAAARLPAAADEAGRAAVAARRLGSDGYERLARAEQALVALRRRDLLAADAWAAGLGPASDLLDYPREPEALVLMRLWIAQGRSQPALDLLDQLLAMAREAGRLASVIEIQLLRALALERARQTTEALAAISSALHEAEPGGFVRVFLDEGEPLRRLLQRAAGAGLRLDSRLLAASAAGGLLSAREREVLRLVAQGCTNREIGERLVISQNTVKAHLHHLATKLEASSRTTILARARALDLLDPA
jgi:LuxR family maltose regulon positive regulatory protein